MISLGNRAHTFAKPDSREKLTAFFTSVLGCEVVMRPAASVSSDAAGRRTLAIAFTFPGGGSLSFEFTDDALDEQQMRRGIYLELRTDDPSVLRQKILAAGVPQLDYPGNRSFYFQAPGGPVMRIEE